MNRRSYLNLRSSTENYIQRLNPRPFYLNTKCTI